MAHWTLREISGPAAEAHLEELASLRIRVFREFPYLYEGDLDYERRYLRTYFACPRSFVALCEADGRVVGASTAIPLQDAERDFQEPFLRAGIPVDRVCYYGESVLLSDYRGLGIGRAFMRSREGYARSLPGVDRVAFCAVVRDKNHPRRPAAYRPLDDFWRSEGFALIPGMVASYSWRDLGETVESAKPMQFWLKTLEDP